MTLRDLTSQEIKDLDMLKQHFNEKAYSKVYRRLPAEYITASKNLRDVRDINRQLLAELQDLRTWKHTFCQLIQQANQEETK